MSRSHAQAQIDEYLRKAQDLCTKSIVEIIATIRPLIPTLSRFTDEEVEEMVLISLNYEEDNVESFSFRDAIAWIKTNFDRNLHYGGCILRNLPEQKARLTENRGADGASPSEVAASAGNRLRSLFRLSPSRIRVDLCFLDKQGEPLIAAGAKHKVVHAERIEDDLERQFAGKDMIIIK